jgi:ribonucleotide reductase alpha subunit
MKFFCAEVPDTHSFVIESNILSGNCFVIHNDSDSYSGIMRTDEQLAHLMKRRAGVGTDISHLRPESTPVNNAARTSTGAVSFMERYSNTTREVAQSGRRGALLLSISGLHPDVEDFIDIKMDATKVTGANISIRQFDEFLEAVDRGDESFILRFPVDKPIEEATFTKEVNPQVIWQKIIKNAHARAEPGLLFWDTILRESLPDCYADLGFETISTNPCQPAFAKVLTKQGIRDFGDISEGAQIWSEDGWTTVAKKWSSGIKPVYKYQTTAGSFVATENHRILSSGVKQEIGVSDSIDLLQGEINLQNKYNPQDIMDGLVIGDGSRHKQSKDKAYLLIGNADSDYFDSEISHLISEPHAVKYNKAWKIETTIQLDELPALPKRTIPDRFYYGNSVKVKSFLRGLYSANGSICGKRITLKSSSFKLIEQVQEMLSSIGIRSYYTTNKPTKIEWDNGEYVSKTSYDLNISTDREIFIESVGFLQRYKRDKVRNIIAEMVPSQRPQTHDIVNVEYLGDFEVFDITVDGNSHTYWSNGFNSSNCGEITLCDSDSCRLLAINLYSFVENPFTDKASFNWKALKNSFILANV